MMADVNETEHYSPATACCIRTLAPQFQAQYDLKYENEYEQFHCKLLALVQAMSTCQHREAIDLQRRTIDLLKEILEEISRA